MSKKIRKILIIRFSALGDIAMTIPVIASFASKFPEVSVTLLSQSKVAPLMIGLPPNVHFKGIDVKRDYSGIHGLNRLYRELKAECYDAVADFHYVLRTQFLDLKFRLSGVPVAHIRKGRCEKKLLVTHLQKQQLATSFMRYRDVLSELGFDFAFSYHPGVDLAKARSLVQTVETGHISATEAEKPHFRVGIAPFAKHAGKIYPAEKMCQVISTLLSTYPTMTLFLFGAKGKEHEILDCWAQYDRRIVNLSGLYALGEELLVISRMNVMITMDSANMHLASLVGTPVVSIWGATHPYAGFLGWNQSEANIAQVDLECRPCSIFGNKPCKYGTYDCLHKIAPQTVVDHVSQIITAAQS